MRFAYADPPYPGMGHYYEGGREVNHRLLLAHLCDEFDGWALSTASTTLLQVLADTPEHVRIGAWTKPFASFKPGVTPGYCWEPVLFVSGRSRDRTEATVRDWCAANITMQRGFTGAKPDKVCRWIFDLIGAQPGDDFTDIFPGSGAVGRAWDAFCNSPITTPGTLFAQEATA